MFYTESLPKSPTAASVARRLLDRLTPEVDSLTLENARLLVSELVTNAYEHVSGTEDIELRVRLHEGVLHIEVQDSGPGFVPEPRGADAAKDSGWGLHFTQLLSLRWGVERENGTCVWFELEGRAVP